MLGLCNLLSSIATGDQIITVCEILQNREENSSKYHYGNAICIEMKITKPYMINKKQRCKMVTLLRSLKNIQIY